jgi:predicted  nucleic acid-binding Zn-ribbon protein
MNNSSGFFGGNTPREDLIERMKASDDRYLRISADFVAADGRHISSLKREIKELTAKLERARRAKKKLRQQQLARAGEVRDRFVELKDYVERNARRLAIMEQQGHNVEHLRKALKNLETPTTVKQDGNDV